MDKIKRITGLNCQKILRIHNFLIGKSKQILLRKIDGVSTYLISTDINDYNYGLSEEIIEKIKREGHIRINKIKYLNTNIRLEYCDNVLSELSKDTKSDQINVFTHEWIFYDNLKDIIDKLEVIGNFALNNKAKFI